MEAALKVVFINLNTENKWTVLTWEMKNGCKKTQHIAQRTIRLSQRKECKDSFACGWPACSLFSGQLKTGANPECVHCCPLLARDKLFLQSSTTLERLVLFSVYRNKAEHGLLCSVGRHAVLLCVSHEIIFRNNNPTFIQYPLGIRHFVCFWFCQLLLNVPIFVPFHKERKDRSRYLS